MKKKITFLIAAAVMLLTMMASTGTMLGQSDYSTTYTSNITLPTSGTQASSCVVVIGGTNYDGTKLGKSNAGGSASITAPAGTKYIHLHVAAWKAKSPGFTYTVGSGTAQTITGITSNDGISNNSPFTFSGDASSTNYYKVITLSSALTEATSITFASTSERVVFWGVNTEEEGSGDDPSISAENVEIAYDADYGEIEYTINNPVEYGWIDPSTTADWLTFGNVEDDKVNFVCDHNPNATARTATVTLTYNYNAKATVTKNVTVTQAGDPNGSGSEANPYTVAQARAAIDANSGVTDVYATGIVSEIPTAWNSTYSNITFNFVDNSGDTDFLQAYRCGSGTGVDASEVAVGDIVVVYGNLTKYSSTYEFAQGCTLVSLEHPAVSVEAPTFDPEPGTYEFQVDVTMDCETDGVAIYYTMDGTTPTENSTLFEGDEISVEETTTFKAIAIKGTESSNVTTATYHINSANNPYTVAQALAFLDYPTSTIFVHGIVSTAPAQAPTNNGQMTYYISDNGEATNQLEVYKGKGLNQAAFSAQTDIQVGDIVTITGIVKVYNSTIEFDTDNYLVSFERPAVPSITLPQYEFSLNADGGDAEIPITYTNLAADPQLGVMFCDATGAEYQYSWISGTVSNSTLYGHIDENEGEARTAYFKIKGLDADNNEVYSDLVTINQAASAGAIITFNTTTYTLMAGGESKTISFEYEGLGTNPTFSVNFYSATGEPTQYDWITAEVQTDDNKVDVNVVANEGEARTAYFKVSGVNGAVNAESNLVTINQEAGGTPSTSFTWDLSIASYDEITDPDIVTWSSNYAIMTNSSKSGGTSASNYLGGDSNNRTSSRFYNGNTLTITPVAGYAITSLVFTATSHNYAAALQGSTWTNATATMEEGDNVKDVTITPTDGTSVITAAITGTCGFTAVTVNYVANSNPTINANDVSIAYDATEGMIEYTIINPVEGASLEAVPTHGGDVFIMGEAANGVVPFTCSVNEQATERTATVELRYTYNRATITKEVIITQAGNPAVISNISNITATGDYTVQGTVVAISNRGFILGDGTGYAYYYKGSGFTPGDYNIGDIKKMSGTVGTFNNVYQFPDGTTITDATDSNYNNTPEVQVLDATGIAAYSTNNHLSDYVQFEGTLVKSGNYYNVQVADLATDASISFPTSAQTTALDALENKTIVVKGYFAGVSGGHFGVILESAEETTTPNISVTPDEINVDAAEHEGTLTITVSNLTIDDPNTDLGIQFYDGNGTEIENPTWIALDDFEVSGENFTVYYVIGENEGELRQAFLKVYSMDANTEFIYSNLVSINQAAPVTPPTGDEYDLYSGDLVEGDYIIYYDGSAMKNTIDSGRLY